MSIEAQPIFLAYVILGKTIWTIRFEESIIGMMTDEIFGQPQNTRQVEYRVSLLSFASRGQTVQRCFLFALFGFVDGAVQIDFWLRWRRDVPSGGSSRHFGH